MKYASVRIGVAENLQEARSKLNVTESYVVPEPFIHTCSSEKGKVFWVIEDSDQGRADHFCNLEAIPEIWHENSKFKFRQLWNHAFIGIKEWELNELFESNQIEFRFV